MNRQAFSQEYMKCKDRLVGRLVNMTRNREVAEDIASAAFEIALKKLDTFRGECALPTWIHAIAMNELKSWARRKPHVPLELLEGSSPRELIEPDLLEQTHDRAECLHRMRQVLRRIPAIHRRALMDHFIDGYSVRQIARRRRIPQGTVLSRIFSGKRYLRAAWAA
jgi:RNA polymerase sigma-70 factor (ECF subfamily)